MDQLTTFNAIPSSFEGLTKTQISARVKESVEFILENGGVEAAAETLSIMGAFIDEVKKDQRFKDYIREELSKNGGKITTKSGAKIELAETGVSYDYTNNSAWVEQKAIVDEESEKLKALENKLKTIPAGKLLVDSDTGETFIGPAKKSTSSYKITLKK